MSTLAERLDRFELDLRRMQRELESLRRESAAAAAPPAPLEAAVTVVPDPPQPPIALEPASSVAPPRPPRIDPGELLARFDLLGARGLAVAGGTVTALGITLLFVLAAERGWIGPEERVAAGAVLSALVFAEASSSTAGTARSRRA
jgi:uncharacterized membrane protein